MVFLKIIKILLRVLFVDLEVLQNAMSEVSELIYEKLIHYYYHQLARKLMDPSASGKTYWSLLKTFYNDKKYH